MGVWGLVGIPLPDAGCLLQRSAAEGVDVHCWLDSNGAFSVTSDEAVFAAAFTGFLQ